MRLASGISLEAKVAELKADGEAVVARRTAIASADAYAAKKAPSDDGLGDFIAVAAQMAEELKPTVARVATVGVGIAGVVAEEARKALFAMFGEAKSAWETRETASSDPVAVESAAAIQPAGEVGAMEATAATSESVAIEENVAEIEASEEAMAVAAIKAVSGSMAAQVSAAVAVPSLTTDEVLTGNPDETSNPPEGYEWGGTF
eukprot:5689416-Prymnesium_polylepis.2